MSSTIITAIKAARVLNPWTAAPAYMGPGGNLPVFVLFEAGYESNVYPKTPRWQASCVGDADTCRDYVLRAAASCEGGMLRWHKERSTTPERAIGRWRKALAAPVTVEIADLEVRFAPSYNRVSPDRRGAYDEILARHPGVAPRVNTPGSLELSMRDVAEWNFVVELLTRRSETHLCPWMLLDRAAPMSEPRPDLGIPRPRPPKGDVTKRCRRLPQVFDLLPIEEQNANGTEAAKSWRNHLAIYSDGTLHVGWAYSLIGHYVGQHLRAVERAEPGTAEPLATAMRCLVEAALGPSPGMRLQLRRPEQFERPEYEAAWQGLVGLVGHPAFQASQAAALAVRELTLPWAQVLALPKRDAVQLMQRLSNANVLAKVDLGAQSNSPACAALPGDGAAAQGFPAAPAAANLSAVATGTATA